MLAQAYQNCSDHRCKDADRREQQRKQRALLAKRGKAQRNGGYDRHRIGFEQIGSHAGHIPYVVPHVIRNNCRIARVILGNAGLDLPHQIGAHIRRLGIDAPANARKQRNGRDAQAVIKQNVWVADQIIQHPHTQKAKSRYSKACYRSSGKGDGKRTPHTVLLGGVGCAHIGAGCNIHPEKAGQNRRHCADQKRGGAQKASHHGNHSKYNRNENRQNFIFRPQKSIRAVPDCRGNLFHPLCALRLCRYLPCKYHCRKQRSEGSPSRQIIIQIHSKTLLCIRFLFLSG